jgi:sugar lactone lactonase YvrE
MLRTRRSLIVALSVATLGTAVGIGVAAPASATDSFTFSRGLPSVINAQGDTLYPEGVAYDPSRRALLVSSARNGTVSVVGRDGKARTLINDPTLISTFGLTVDEKRKRVLVTFGDIGVGTRTSPTTAQRQSGLGIFDLRTGKRIKLVNLEFGAEPRAANDVSVDRDGNAYVTDTFGDAIYRVDRHGRVTNQIRDPRFASEAFGLNGIVAHPDGFLLATKYDSGELFKVSTDGKKISAVALDQPILGGDGLALRRDGSLIVVTNRLGSDGLSAVRVLRPGFGWRSATTTKLVNPWPDAAPTTVAVTPSGAYVLSGQLDKLLAGDQTQTTFTLRRL